MFQIGSFTKRLNQIHQQSNSQRSDFTEAKIYPLLSFLWVKTNKQVLFEDKFHIICERKVFQEELRVKEITNFLNVNWIVSLCFLKNSHQLPIDLPSVNCFLPASRIPLPTVLCIGYIPPPGTCLRQGSENQGSWIESRLPSVSIQLQSENGFYVFKWLQKIFFK